MTRRKTWDVLDCGGNIFAVRGHVGTYQWETAVQAYMCNNAQPTATWTRQEWQRFVPTDDGGEYQTAQPESRGAFPVTYGEAAWPQ
jgi:hypothetical protein